jgi:S1-C subfamily serine protease
MGMQVMRKTFLMATIISFITINLLSTALAATNAVPLLESNIIADIAERVAPAVVNIDISKSVKLGNFNLPIMPFGKTELFFNGQRITPEQLESGKIPGFEKHDTASGFIIRSDGYILTNAHVVGNSSNIKVTFNDNKSMTAKVIGIDNFSDLAVIKVEAKDLPVLSMGTSTGLRPGDFVIAIGNPLGYDHTVTLGIISAIGRTVTDVNGNINFIQTDAAINPGNSGGPLLNLKGEVIGVNTAIRRDAQNIGFSIPVDVAKNVAQDLIAYGKISRPWLGIKMQEIDDELAKAVGVAKGTKGVVVAGFVQGSPALASGIKQGDIIQKIDGREINTAKEVKDYVLSHKVGDTLHFLVLREGNIEAVPINIGNYPSLADQSKAQPLQQPIE